MPEMSPLFPNRRAWKRNCMIVDTESLAQLFPAESAGVSGRIVFSRLDGVEVRLPPSGLSVKYVADGEEIYEIADRSIPVRSGQFLVVDAFTPCQAKVRRGRTAIGLCAYLPAASAGSGPDLTSVFERIDAPAVLQPAGLSCLGAILDAAVRERLGRADAAADDTALLNAVEQGLHRFVHDIGDRLGGLTDMRASTRREALVRLERVRAWMHECSTDALPLDALASAAGMSRFHFVRRFRQVYGRSPVAYHAELRIRGAAERIRKRDLTPSDACDELGYSDMRAFRRAFERVTGESPNRVFAG